MQETAETALERLAFQDQVIFDFTETSAVHDAETKRNAENLIIGAKTALKRAKAVQADLVAPMLEGEKRIRALFKPYLEKLGLCVDRIDKALGVYHNQELIRAREEQEHILGLEAQKIAEANITGEIVEPTRVEVPTPAKTSRADMGSVTYREGFDIQVVQPELVPRDLCDPSMSKIRKRVESGIRDIPGVLITAKHFTAAKAQ